MRNCCLLPILVIAFVSPALAEDAMIRHEIKATIEPAANSIFVTDLVTLPPNAAAGQIEFYLHAGLEVESMTPGVTIAALDDPGNDPVVIPPRKRYSVNLNKQPAGPVSFSLQYKGKINHPIEQLGREYARGFSLTPGLITDQGVFLAGSTLWVPWFGEGLFSFSLTVDLPEGWDSVSQGERTLHEKKGGRRITRWDSKEPMDEVYLVAARFTEYSFCAGAVKVMAFLRTPDENLANKYLETTAQYIEMYRQLVGPYPFSKFALVENFWQTGYGMPSFTLLGDQIIRFPFILHSSYPHELLHNYWGNSVFVDYSKGNWCEGATVYYADHLIAEQRGQGLQYRRTSLQKYADYVTPANDFPLSRFGSRTDAATEAIGYGKSMMVLNMLRCMLGDEAFVRGFQKFYRDNRFRAASFDDMRQAFEGASNKDLKWFFGQWVERTAAPELRLLGVKCLKEDAGYRLKFVLEQVQQDDPFRLEVPVVVSSAKGTEFVTVAMDGRRANAEGLYESEPLLIQVDPLFDLFRKLHPFEVPPSLSKIFGSEKILILLPSCAKDEVMQAYSKLAGVWAKDDSRKITVSLDAEVSRLPADSAVWIFGNENLHSGVVAAGLAGQDAGFDGPVFRMGKSGFDRTKNSCVVAVRHPENPGSVAVLLTIGNSGAVDGLSRKLLHYGKYSALVFEGIEPENTAKESWPAVGSPLVAELGEPGVGSSLPHARELPARPALARLAPVFSSERLMSHVAFLSSLELEGRGLGSAGIEKAAEYIAAKFREAGLKQGGDDGSYFQSFEDVVGPDGRKGTLKNVIAVIPGTRPEWKDQSVVICAHYDHLGLGWPDVKKGNDGKIHPGADDNGSGVAVLLELAGLLGKSFQPERTVVFVAFSGEEKGLAGSRHYVRNMKTWPAAAAIAALNLDTVGRLGSNKLLIINGSSAREWKFIFMGCGYVTGVESEVVTADIASSDQVSFIEAGVPAVQLFSGAHVDYHTPSDTADKIDAAGLMKVAAFAREALVYLAARPEPLTFQIGKADAQPGKPGPPGAGRRASTGSMPDMAFSGKGVKIASIGDVSPAQKAGLKAGDVIVRIAGKDVENLRDYSNALKELKPGDEVELVFKRDGVEASTKIVLGER